MSFLSGSILLVCLLAYYRHVYSAQVIAEPIQACVIDRNVTLNNAARAKIARCLGWQSSPSSPICKGWYQPIEVQALSDPEEIHIDTDRVSFYQNQRSTLKGNVQVQQANRIVNAQTAYVYRDPKTNQVTKIEFLGEVRYLEPNKLMIAKKAEINPQDSSGEVQDVLYRFNIDRSSALLPAWGRASLIKRFPNKDYLLQKATYTTCAPQDKAWDIQADSITLDDAKATGVAKNARLRIKEVPILYTPYLSFPTSKERKSGFLLPIVGYSNVGGFDLGVPYYWNIAPNYDLTFVPHVYSERGVMLGGEYRYLTSKSLGFLTADFLPDDRAYANFLNNNEELFPRLQGSSTNRWQVGYLNTTNITSDLQFNVNLKQVSDDYYLQDFSTNLAVATERQLLRQADLTYTNENWVIRGMAQSYQTLHPINEIPIANVYERLPQLMAQGTYADLPFQARLDLTGQYDQFYWQSDRWIEQLEYRPQGPRFYANPILSLPYYKPWGYITPAAELVQNYYQVQNNNGMPNTEFNHSIPRFDVDGGLFFERNATIARNSFTQTLEPRLFYLYVPYQDQSMTPVYDSGYMIFNTGQLFRTNRFSGFDRIGDANQLTYALTTRWLFQQTGAELAVFSIGQIRYFSDRKVQLCQSPTGFCLDDPNAFGFLSPTEDTSPVAANAAFNISPVWKISSDYIWNPATRSTNNGDVNLHYQPQPNQIVSFGYSYLVNGDVTSLRDNAFVNNALHQATLAFAWPISDRWSSVGAYSQNISKNYSMMSLIGLQYDSCCWAMRLVGGRSFKNLNENFQPQYNNNVYLQVLLKGLGSVANSDPGTILSTYIPGYNDQFRN
ncbi:MAG: LPS-assembly protein LptD [Legionella sp.]|jgi:LPS-assembly protein